MNKKGNALLGLFILLFICYFIFTICQITPEQKKEIEIQRCFNEIAREDCSSTQGIYSVNIKVYSYRCCLSAAKGCHSYSPIYNFTNEEINRCILP